MLKKSIVFSVTADLKYRALNGPIGDQKHKRKGWSIIKMNEMLNEEGDICPLIVVNQLEKMKKDGLKGDDLADCYIQYRGWLVKNRKLLS